MRQPALVALQGIRREVSELPSLTFQNHNPVQSQRPRSYDSHSLNFDLNRTHTYTLVIMFEQGSLFWLFDSTDK